MRKSCMKLICILLACAMSVLASGCAKQYEKYEDGLYKDKYICFTMPEDYILAIDSTKEMGKLYKNFYTFKGEKDVSGNNIMYYTMAMGADAAKIFADDDDKIVDRIKAQYRAKDKSIAVYDFHRLDFEGYEGYFIYYGIGAFGTDIEQDESRQASITVVLFRESDYVYSTIVFNSMDRECEAQYLDCAKTVQPNK